MTVFIDENSPSYTLAVVDSQNMSSATFVLTPEDPENAPTFRFTILGGSEIFEMTPTGSVRILKDTLDFETQEK